MKFLNRIIFFIIVNSLCAYSQGIDNLWMMGYESWAGFPYGGINIDFNSGTPNIYGVNRIQNFKATNANITDNSGNLLFSSNGVWIADATGDTMLNGSGLNPSNYTASNTPYGLYIAQGNVIIPAPRNSELYYLFHITIDETTLGGHYITHNLYCSTIDMSLNGGLGAVINKNAVILNGDIVPGKLTAVKHGNGIDWWLIGHLYNSYSYVKFLIDSAGIHGPYNIGAGVLRLDATGQCAFSADGNKMAYYDVITDLDIFDFDRCSGTLSNFIHIAIDDSAQSAGVAFSPSGRFLYVPSMNYLYQYDLQSSNIDSSRITVGIWDGFYSPQPPFATYFFLAQLAPDNKIYINCSNGTQAIHVINYPDSIGLACDLCQHCVQLPFYNAFTLPTPPNYHLGNLPGSICDTLLSVNNLTDLKFSFYPNPVTNKLQLHFEQDYCIDQIRISNILGEIFYTDQNSGSLKDNVTINTEHLSPGIYICNLSILERNISFKFIKE